MPAAPIIGAGITGISGLIGSGKAAHQQQQANNAANQAAAAQSKLYGAEAGDINQLLGQYFGQTVPQENALMGSFGGQMGAAGNQFGQAFGQAGGDIAGMGNTISALQNFQGLKPQEMAALQTALGNQGLSTINTLRGGMGGYANPNEALQAALNANNQNALNATVQLGGMGAQQELGALQGAGGLQSSQAGLESGLAGLANSRYQGLAGGLESLLGMQSGMMGQAMGGMNQMAGGYGAAGAQAAKNAASYGNPWASGLTSFGNALSGIFPGGSTNYGSPGGTPGGASANFPSFPSTGSAGMYGTGMDFNPGGFGLSPISPYGGPPTSLPSYAGG